MPFNSPLSTEKADRLIEALGLGAQHRVVDIGCGEGEFLRRLHRATGAHCLGIDIDAALVESAGGRLAPDEAGGIEFRAADINTAGLAPGSFDLAVCMGSSHAFGSGADAYPNALTGMRALLREGGLVLIGEGYWKQPPAGEYLDFIGEPVGIYNSHEQNIGQAESLGFLPLYACTANADEWDHFEWSFRMRAERAALAAPQDADAQAKCRRVREWNRHYRMYGRSTMGFGFYLFTSTPPEE